MSTLARVTQAGIASHDTIDGEERGVHLKRHGAGAGVVLTMPSSDRSAKAGKANLDSQRTSEPIMLLEHVSSDVPGTTSMSKYSRNQAAIADVLLKEQFLKKIDSSARARIAEWKEAASNSEDNSHTFTTKKHINNAPRATDRWKLSLHESVESVKTIAPEAEKKDDRKASASYREGEAQRKRKHK